MEVQSEDGGLDAPSAFEVRRSVQPLTVCMQHDLCGKFVVYLFGANSKFSDIQHTPVPEILPQTFDALHCIERCYGASHCDSMDFNSCMLSYLLYSVRILLCSQFDHGNRF